MPDLSKLEELWRRSFDLNIRYYGAVGRLTADYFKDLASVLSGQGASPKSQGAPSGAGHAEGAHAATASHHAAQGQAVGAMVLEGEAGGRVLGVFMVENHFGQEISAKVVASPFADAGGHTIQPLMAFEPETIALGPGEQLLVRVTAVIDDTLEPGVRYLGQFTIPGLTGTRVPVVLRRRAGQTPPGAASEASVPDAAGTGPSAGRRRAVKDKDSGAGEGVEG